MSSLSIGQVASYKSLTKCGQEELAIHQIMATPTGGIMFARNPSGEEKRAARQTIIDIVKEIPGPISLLTMPGLKWKFEGAVLKERETMLLKEGEGPNRTIFTCIENDRSIFHAAMIRMPGMRNPANVFRCIPPTAFSERGVSSLWIDRFYFGNVDDLLAYENNKYDVAWLDYTGPLSIKRLALIAKFFDKQVSKLLVLTSLGARWDRQTSDTITRLGFYNWVTGTIQGTPVHSIQYMDSSPMLQIAFRK